MINTSPEPFSNWGASAGEDMLVFAGLWTALNHPVLFLVLLVFFVGIMVWVLPKIARAIKRVFGLLGRMLGLGKQEFSQPKEGPYETLEKLKHLCDIGAITEEEYEKEKAKILHPPS